MIQPAVARARASTTRLTQFYDQRTTLPRPGVHRKGASAVAAPRPVADLRQGWMPTPMTGSAGLKRDGYSARFAQVGSGFGVRNSRPGQVVVRLANRTNTGLNKNRPGSGAVYQFNLSHVTGGGPQRRQRLC